jgi:hypothetical protein
MMGLVFKWALETLVEVSLKLDKWVGWKEKQIWEFHKDVFIS